MQVTAALACAAAGFAAAVAIMALRSSRRPSGCHCRGCQEGDGSTCCCSSGGRSPSSGSGAPGAAAPASSEGDAVELRVAKAAFKFNAAHFMVQAGETRRERLHGHSYKATLRLRAPAAVVDAGPQPGYVLDFGEVKAAVTAECRALDERFLLPERSPVLSISTAEGQVDVRVATDGTRFSLPEADVARLPIAHSSAEELARLLCRRVVARLGPQRLRDAGVQFIEMGVMETAGQEAAFSMHL